MSVMEEYLARKAVQEALKKERREKWRRRFGALTGSVRAFINKMRESVKEWRAQRKSKRLAAMSLVPAPSATAASARPNAISMSDWRRVPPFIRGTLALTLFGVAMAVYGLTSWSIPPLPPNTGEILAIAVGIIATLMLVAAIIIQLNKGGVSWKIWPRSSAPAPAATAAPTPVATVPTATGATAPVRRRDWDWKDPIKWTVTVVGVILIAVIGYKLAYWLMASNQEVVSAYSPSARSVKPEGATLLADCEVVKDAEMSFPVTAPKGSWSKTYCFPPNMNIEWRVLSGSGHYTMRTPTGEYSFTPKRQDVVKGSITQAAFMATGETEETVWITLRREAGVVTPSLIVPSLPLAPLDPARLPGEVLKIERKSA